MASESITPLDIFNTAGTLVALVLGYYKLKQYRKKKVNLEIQIEPTKFYSRDSNMSPKETKIAFDLDIRNAGLEPTTISSIQFKNEVEGLEECDMKNRTWTQNQMIHSEFNPIRLSKNDRKDVSIHTTQNAFIDEDTEEIEGELVFNTTHEDVTRDVTITRTDQ